MVDLPTYLRGGSRCFAAIVEPSEGDGSVFFPSLSPEQIRPTLGPRGVIPTRARAYHEGPVLVDIDADDVSERLEHLQAYPLDLDAVGHGMSVRFASVAAK